MSFFVRTKAQAKAQANAIVKIRTTGQQAKGKRQKLRKGNRAEVKNKNKKCTFV